MADQRLNSQNVGSPNQLEFAPANNTVPAAPPLVSLLTALGGLGLNIGGAIKGGNAQGAGNAATGFAMQQADRGARNRQIEQRNSDAEKQAAALFKQAQSLGMPSEMLETVRQFGNARDVNGMRSTIGQFQQLRSWEGRMMGQQAAEARRRARAIGQEVGRQANSPQAKALEAMRTLAPDATTKDVRKALSSAGIRNPKDQVLYMRAFADAVQGATPADDRSIGTRIENMFDFGEDNVPNAPKPAQADVFKQLLTNNPVFSEIAASKEVDKKIKRANNLLARTNIGSKEFREGMALLEESEAQVRSGQPTLFDAPRDQGKGTSVAPKSKAPEGERMYSPSRNKYFIKKPDGTIVPE